MGILNLFRRSEARAVESAPVHGTVAATPSGGVMALSLDDPLLLEFVRGGEAAVTGQTVNVERALRNPALFRAVSLIANAIGMLPTHVIDAETKEKQTDHPLFAILHREPNGWQSAFDFKALMQLRALVYGDAYALIVRGLDVRSGKQRILRLVPLDPSKVNPVQGDDWVVRYEYQPKIGGKKVFAADDIFHLRGMSLDGLRGISLVKQARDAIGIAISAELATGRLFKNGVIGGTALKHPAKLSPEAHGRLKKEMDEYTGAENAGKVPIFEENMDWAHAGSSAKDAELSLVRKMQIEEIARITGVPRPLLMVDETSWGSGIEALGQFFVSYALNPWFEAWQQAAERSLIAGADRGRLVVKFNPAALLRGSLKDQADFLAKALGSGGHAPWMHVDEVRDVMDLPEREAPPHVVKSTPSPAPNRNGADAEGNPAQ